MAEGVGISGCSARIACCVDRDAIQVKGLTELLTTGGTTHLSKTMAQMACAKCGLSEANDLTTHQANAATNVTCQV